MCCNIPTPLGTVVVAIVFTVLTSDLQTFWYDYVVPLFLFSHNPTYAHLVVIGDFLPFFVDLFFH